jgi:hypothetical protein
MSEKRRFWRFIGENERETARFSPFLAILYYCEGLYDFLESLHHHPWAGLFPRQ